MLKPIKLTKKISHTDKILIVGGMGFIGRSLVKKCLNYTSNITCISLRSRDNENTILSDVEVIKCDITNKERLKKVLYKKSFDYVFNLGGYIDHTPYFQGGRKLIESHFRGLLNLIDCLDIKNLQRFVQIGSSDEYGNVAAPQNESIREAPISPYSLAKTASSHFIQMISNTEDFPGIVLRFFLVYGPEQDEKRFLPQIIKGCLENTEFKTSKGKQLRDFCYIDDIVAAIIKAAVSPSAKGHILNIASGVPISIREVIEKVIKITGGGMPLLGEHPYRKGENMALYADISLAKNILNWKPRVSIEAGLRKTVNYYKEKYK
jgi:nucleoside-diphosphate-sugar epimerase